MIKNIYNSWNFGDTTIKPIRMDDAGLVKRAKWYVEYKSAPGYTLVNALFLGSGEYYSCNHNGDYFEEDELLNSYRTFLKGHHFKHHENDDPKKSFGDILDVFFNPEMHRIEGIIKLINEKSPEMIKKIEMGIPVPLSMACKVKYDVCSICGHKSFNMKDYCDHLKYHMCEIMDNGKKVYALNPNPEFFDISEVIKGADPTAFTLKKVASCGSFNPGEKIANLDKQSILDRLASIEKRITMLIDKKDPKVEILGKSIDKNAKISDDIPLAALAKFGIALRPRDFGVSGRCTMFDKLSSKDLEKIKYFENNGNIDYNSIEKRSILKNYADSRIKSNMDRKVEFCKNAIKDDSFIKKLALLNFAIVYNNRIDDLSIEEMIVQNNM